jgi:hypothetical protein
LRAVAFTALGCAASGLVVVNPSGFGYRQGREAHGGAVRLSRADTKFGEKAI